MKRIFTAAALVAALILTGCSAGGGAPEPSGSGDANFTVKELKVATQVEPSSWDPSAGNEGALPQYYQMVYDTLILREANGDLSPMLATEWSYNDDNTELTLTLRDDVTFEDGTPFDGQAVKANVESFQAANGPQAAQLASVDSVEVVSPTEVTLTLSTPDPALLVSLSNIGGLMANPNTVGTDAIKTQPDGTGPYTLESATPGSQYHFVKKENYWNPDIQKFESATFLLLADLTARLNALLSGQVDAASLDAKTLAQAESAGMTNHPNQVNWSGFNIYDRNGELNPALGDVRVRQAINFAVDRQAILDNFFGGEGDITTQMFGPSTNAYDAALDDVYSYDPDQAKTLLEEAGYGDGFDLEIAVLAGRDPAQLAAIADQLGAVGIRVTWAELPSTTYAQDAQSGRYAAILQNLLVPSTWRTIQQSLEPNSPWNPFHVEDSTVLDYRDQLQVDPENDEAAVGLNTYIVEEAWAAPWFRADAMYVTSPNITTDVTIEQVVPSIYGFAPAK